MDHSHRVVDLIERANDLTPFCSCGRTTTPAWRDGVVWLECASLVDPQRRGLRRVLGALAAPAHVHAPIVDLREVLGPEAVAA